MIPSMCSGFANWAHFKQRLRPFVHPRFSDLNDRPVAQKDDDFLIPAYVYQTLESRRVDRRHFDHAQEFRALNPGLSFQLFDANARDEYMEEYWQRHPVIRIYREALFPVMKADIFRYCIIFERGGYYVDATKGIFSGLRSFHSKTDSGLIAFERNQDLKLPPREAFNIMKHPDKLVVNWAFGFSKNHPILEQMIQNVVDYSIYFRGVRFEIPKTAILSLTATGMFTKSVKEYLVNRGSQGIAQAGIDFEGAGLFRLRGANNPWPPVRYHYSEARDAEILRSNSGP